VQAPNMPELCLICKHLRNALKEHGNSPDTEVPESTDWLQQLLREDLWAENRQDRSVCVHACVCVCVCVCVV
jgi:hypothetical protein